MTKGGSRRFDGTVIEAISSFFTISHIEEEGGVHTFKIQKSSYDPEKFRKLFYRLRASGYYVYSNGQDEIIVLRKTTNPRKGAVKYILLFLTIATIIYSGYTYSSGYYVTYAHGTVILLSLLYFALPVGVILFMREFPKFLIRRKREQKYSLPILVPNPFLMGTMGIINSSEEPFLNTSDEVYSGLFSLVSGFSISALFLFMGNFGISLYTGKFVPTNAAESILHSPILLSAFGSRLLPSTGFLDPLSLAGWSGLTFTAFNSFPVGLLDGGFVLSGLSRTIRLNISYIFLTVMVVISLTYLSWLILPMFLAFIGLSFIEPADSNIRISPFKFLAAILIVASIAVVGLTPFPVQQAGPVVSVSDSGQWDLVVNSTGQHACFNVNVTNLGQTNIVPGFSVSPNMPMEVSTENVVLGPRESHMYQVVLNTTTASLGNNKVSLNVFIGTLERSVSLIFMKIRTSKGAFVSPTPTYCHGSNGTMISNLTFENRGMKEQNVTLMIGAPAHWQYTVHVYDSSVVNTASRQTVFAGVGSNNTGGITFPINGSTQIFSSLTVEIVYNTPPANPVFVAIYNNTYTGSVVTID